MYSKIRRLVWIFVFALGMVACKDSEKVDNTEETYEDSQNQQESVSQKRKGVYITYQVVYAETPDSEVMSDIIYKLQKRADLYGKEATVYQDGENCIKVEIPDVEKADEILQELGRNAELLFISETTEDGNLNYSCASDVDESGESIVGYFLVRDLEAIKADGSVKLTGTEIESVNVSNYQNVMGITDIVLELKMTEEGSRKFEEATKYAYEHGETLGIYYDGEFLSVPKVTDVITNGVAVIQGMESHEETEHLATMLRIGNLSYDLKVMQVDVVE